jgi:hypothetical protein
VPVSSFELTATARELRSTLQMVEFRLESEVTAPTRREVRLVIGELVARWLQCAGALEPMILTVTVLEDRIRLDISASRADLRSEVWRDLCRASGLGLTTNAEPHQRSDSGVFVELPLGHASSGRP